MLAANVAFLAIPGVILAPQYPPSTKPWIRPSPAQITSSISLVFSIGSIITGLLLIRRNRTMMTKDPRNAVSNKPITSHVPSFDSLPVVLPSWDELASGRPRTVGYRFQSDLRSIDVVVCNLCLSILDLGGSGEKEDKLVLCRTKI